MAEITQERGKIAQNFYHSVSATAWMAVFGVMVAGGIGALAVHARGMEAPFEVLPFSLLVAGGFSVLGALMGFLFAIPRSLSNPHAAVERDGKSGHDGLDYSTNTNLEEISDWLTKILVGVGLTQLIRAPDFLRALSIHLGKGVGGADFALSIILFFTPLGFMFGYLWTRMYAKLYFCLGDRSADYVTKESLSQTLYDMQITSADTLLSVRRFLNPRTRERNFSVTQLRHMLSNASPDVREEVRAVAGERLRQAKNAGEANPEMASRVVALLEALLELGPQEAWHLQHFLLGSALTAIDPPSWSRAEKHFGKAIELRNDWQSEGRLDYEFCRAAARIELDADYRNTGKSGDESRKRIGDDLKLAVTQMNRDGLRHEVRELFLAHPAVIRWLMKNDMEYLVPEDLKRGAASDSAAMAAQ